MDAANQSAHHDHFRQHPIGQRSHHQRSFYRDAAYGCRKHHADYTRGLYKAAGREIAHFQSGLIGNCHHARPESRAGIERHRAVKSVERYEPMTDRDGQSAQEADLALLIVKTLNLEVQASEIDPEAPLYGAGLGLDSIDMLEIALAVSKTFGVKLRAVNRNVTHMFSSMR